jgi:hypothetical protein
LGLWVGFSTLAVTDEARYLSPSQVFVIMLSPRGHAVGLVTEAVEIDETPR